MPMAGLYGLWEAIASDDVRHAEDSGTESSSASPSSRAMAVVGEQDPLGGPDPVERLVETRVHHGP